MDKLEFDECISRLQEVSKIIDKLPTEIRSEAFNLLRGYVVGRNTIQIIDSRNHHEDDDSGDETSLFSQFVDGKPSDNVRLVAAFWFQQYGVEPFSIEDVEKIAAGAGITVPARIDMTLRAAKEKGKNLFLPVGSKRYKPTVHGESYLKEKYGVKKGTRKREQDSE